MNVLTCQKLELSDAENYELRQKYGDGLFERFRIITSSPAVSAADIHESGSLPQFTAEPDADRQAFLKRVILEKQASIVWYALLYWIPTATNCELLVTENAQ